MDRFKSIQNFIKAADTGSFQQAAVLQGISPQAVSKAIGQLEKELGVRLFHRTTRSSTLTEEGVRFLERIRGSLDSFESAWADAVQSTGVEGGVIRIAATAPVTKRILIPLIGEFREAHPEVEFDLVVDDHFTDFALSGIDIGFRCGTQPDAHVVVRELLRMQLIVCASPAYVGKHGAASSREELANHFCTGARQPNTGKILPWEFQIGEDVKFEHVSSVIFSNDIEVELQAVLDGVGIGQLDSIVASEHIRNGRLVPMLLETVSERYGVYLYYAPRPDMPLRIRTFIDFAVSSIRSNTQFAFSADELKVFNQVGGAALNKTIDAD